MSNDNDITDAIDRSRRLQHRLYFWHQAVDHSDLFRAREGLLYIVWKGWAAEMERGGKGILAIPLRRMAEVVGRDLHQTWKALEELDRLGWIKIFQRGRGGPEWQVSEHRATKYALGEDRMLTSYFEELARASRAEDLMRLEQYRAWQYQVEKDEGPADLYLTGLEDSPGYQDLAPPLIDYVTDLFEDYDPQSGRFHVDTSLAHRLPSECMDVVDRYSSIGETVHTQADTLLANDDPVRCPIPGCPCGGRIPVPAVATSPLDYTTASETWTPDHAGIRGWLVARQVVPWQPLPEPFRTDRSTVSAGQMARWAGIAPGNAARFANRLAKKGYAERTTDGRWYLLFEEMYRDGVFFIRDKRQQKLHARNHKFQRDLPEPDDAIPDWVPGPPRRTRTRDHSRPSLLLAWHTPTLHGQGVASGWL